MMSARETEYQLGSDPHELERLNRQGGCWHQRRG